MDITKQIKQLNNLNHLHINTHEIFNDKQLANVTPAVFDQPNIRVLGLGFHEVNSIRILSKNLFIFYLLEYSMA
jgi:hypothetical protein